LDLYLTEDTYIHIDVGGGSTELNIFTKGKKGYHQVPLRSALLRILENQDQPQIWTEMENWVKENVKREYGKVTAVGTGGNISKIFELAAIETTSVDVPEKDSGNKSNDRITFN
jgi:exopolyphosphatase/guanosine-5'-triphosphate,3'-diphosphate pyrophosphatase